MYMFIYFWLCWDLHRCVGFPLVEASGGSSLVAVGRLFMAEAFLVVEHSSRVCRLQLLQLLGSRAQAW